ncbi:MAG: hypothetical protein L6Q40_12100 [Azonexus sp.]|nr:hypothetical protein [Azonexus sp.]
MKRRSPTRQQLTAIALIGLPLLTFPLLGLVGGWLGGLPGGFVYLFGVWAVLIGLAAIVTERGQG